MHTVKNLAAGPRIIHARVGKKRPDGSYPSEPVVLQRGESRTLELAHDPADEKGRLRAYTHPEDGSAPQLSISEAEASEDARKVNAERAGQQSGDGEKKTINELRSEYKTVFGHAPKATMKAADLQSALDDEAAKKTNA